MDIIYSYESLTNIQAKVVGYVLFSFYIRSTCPLSYQTIVNSTVYFISDRLKQFLNLKTFSEI